ncbi:hypothetical protein KFE25_007667 [Diacronema lutheri]|uniref:Calcineurin-like phosphoesterase domain-containing protein n=1 Tax=Diacronema lutheri TaxID=2081491 RepID=A0A8J6CE00_DIALT|nr:hypothetical protein KFE25_007667 [Diacronema lutheri]
MFGGMLGVVSLSALASISLLAQPMPEAQLSAKPRCFFAVQLADPQLGIKNAFSPLPNVALDWSRELAMLNLAIEHVNRLAPRFVILSGDMQNWTPAHDGAAASNGVLSAGYGDVGARQAASVRRALDALEPPVLSVTPGNHDLGDAPDASSVGAFRVRWGADRASFVLGATRRADGAHGGVHFLSVDSLLAMNATAPGMRAERDAQLTWLRTRLAAADDTRASGVVLLTHICPFVGAADEPAGWANWPLAEREEVLRMALSREGVRPRLVICGHFHGNVVSSSAAFGAPFDAVTTSAVGCTIAWNGVMSGTHTPTDASEIASAPTGARAFADYVLRDHARGPVDPRRADERVRCAPNVTGVRLFEFCAERGFRHKWFTLDELASVPRLTPAGGAQAFGDAPFTRF